jgi:predicted acyltransferase
LIGVALNWFPFYNKNIEELRIFGVLQRIAITYFISSLIVVFAKFDTIKIIVTSSIMFFCYWLVLIVFTDNPFSLEMNISKKIDSLLLKDSNLYRSFGIPFDPEGLLGSFSSSTQCLLGYIFGKIIFFKKVNSKIIISCSVLMILTGLLLNYFYPINKPLWTGSYVIFTSGIIFLGFFFVDSLSKLNGLGFVKSFLRVFGTNSLMSFILSILLVKIFITLIRIDNVSLYSYVYNNFFYVFFEPRLGSFIYSVVFTFLVWLIMFLLDKKNIHVKI